MGGAPSICYAVPVTQKKEGESAVYRSPAFKDKLYDRPEPHIATLKDVFINCYKKFANNPALGNDFFKQEQLFERRMPPKFNISLIRKRLIVPNTQEVLSSIENFTTILRERILRWLVSFQRIGGNGL